MSDDAGYAADFEAVRAAENEWIAKRREAAGLPPPADDLIGLAFSGGGIRSATFNLGVLQGLEKSGLLRHVDYLSSVSGGGYSASCYTWLRAQLGKAASAASVLSTMLADGSGSVLDWLRAHGKFLVSHRGYSIWTLIASIFAAMFINVLVLGPPLLATIYWLTLDWLRVQWPEWLALPGAHPLQGHHGYWLLMVSGLACLELFPIVAIVFAFVAGIRSHVERSSRRLPARVHGSAHRVRFCSDRDRSHSGRRAARRDGGTFFRVASCALDRQAPVVSRARDHRFHLDARSTAAKPATAADA